MKTIPAKQCYARLKINVLTGFDEHDDDDDNDDDEDDDGDEKDGDDNGDKTNKDKDSKDEGGKDHTKIIIIIVSSVALFSIAAVIGIVVYKRRYK